MIIGCYYDEVLNILDSFFYLYNNIDFVYSCYEVGKRHYEANLWEMKPE
jgi:hypothetical protein